jgi:hypothetical protein
MSTPEEIAVFWSTRLQKQVDEISRRKKDKDFQTWARDTFPSFKPKSILI